MGSEIETLGSSATQNKVMKIFYLFNIILGFISFSCQEEGCSIVGSPSDEPVERATMDKQKKFWGLVSFRRERVSEKEVSDIGMQPVLSTVLDKNHQLFKFAHYKGVTLKQTDYRTIGGDTLSVIFSSAHGLIHAEDSKQIFGRISSSEFAILPKPPGEVRWTRKFGH